MTNLVKYAKSHAQKLAEQIAREWADNAALELHATLSDYFEATTGRESSPTKHAAAPRRKAKLFLRDCVSNDLYKIMFDAGKAAAASGKSSIVLTEAMMGVSKKRIVSLLNNVNASNYRRINFPDCHVSYKTLRNGFEVKFSRQDPLNETRH